MKNIHILALILFAFGLFRLEAQPAKEPVMSMTQIDQLTYRQYLQADWNNLIKTGKKAHKNGIDFYFLEVRMGIAYYHLKKYRKAIKYLEKAFQKDEKNTLVAEYLYGAYLYGGRYLDAQRISNGFNPKLKHKLGIDKNHLIDVAGVDYKMEILDDYLIPVSDEELNQDVITQNTYMGVDLGNYYGPGNLFWLSAGHLQRNFTQNIYENNMQSVYDKTMTQNQFYVAHYSQIATGLNIGLAINWLQINNNDVTYRKQGRNGRIVAVPSKETLHEWIGFGGLRKDIGDFKLGLTISVANIKDQLQAQPAIETYWYPLSNTDLYFFSNFNYKMEYEQNNWYNDVIIKTGIGLRLGKIYVEPAYTYGDLYNFVEADGLIVYNDDEIINNRMELLTYVYLIKSRLKVYAKYQQYTKTNFYQLNGLPQTIDYTNQTITTGVLWNF